MSDCKHMFTFRTCFALEQMRNVSTFSSCFLRDPPLPGSTSYSLLRASSVAKTLNEIHNILPFVM